MKMLDILKILQFRIGKIFGAVLLASILFQSSFFNSPEKQIVICFADNGHIALEKPGECSLTTSYHIHTKNELQLNSKNDYSDIDDKDYSDINDKDCFDIYVSNLDSFEILHKNKINNTVQQFLFYAENILIFDFKNFQHLLSLNISSKKILSEYTTVILLL